MKHSEKKVLKILKNDFTLDEWKNFEKEIQENVLILKELIKKLENMDIGKIDSLCEEYPFIIKHLPKNVQLTILTSQNFSYMSDEIQMKFMEKDETKIKYGAQDVQFKYLDLNPMKISFATPDVQRKLINKNKFYLEYASKDIQIEYAKKNVNYLSKCSNYVQCSFIKMNPNYYNKCSVVVRQQIVSLANLSPEKISIKTLEAYLSNHSENLSINEIKKYRNIIETTTREDKEELKNYMDYLIVNIEKKRMHQ